MFYFEGKKFEFDQDEGALAEGDDDWDDEDWGDDMEGWEDEGDSGDDWYRRRL